MKYRKAKMIRFLIPVEDARKLELEAKKLVDEMFQAGTEYLKDFK